MKKYEQIYSFELDKLKKQCDELEIDVEIKTDQIEYVAILTGRGQVDIFGESNDSRIFVETAIETKIRSDGKLVIDASRLKKIIKLVEKAGAAFFVANRENDFQ